MRKHLPYVTFILTSLWLAACPVHAAETKAAPVPAEKPGVVAAAPVLPPADTIGVNGEMPPVPAMGFFPILPYDADADLAPQLLPVASNRPLGGDQTHVTRAIIIIHDISRDAIGSVAMLTALAGPDNGTTLIIAPQFLLESDIARFAGHLPDQGRSLARWALAAWQDGGESTAWAPTKGISSFTALDLILAYLGDPRFFPALKNVVIAGHGAGGDFVLRYAAAGKAPDLLDGKGIAVRFAAADPSSYLYFTPMRPFADRPGFTLPDAKKCPGYDAYPYGLGDLNEYARRTGLDGIRLRYPARRVVYLAGEKAGADDRFPDASCAALFEGADRVARMRNYNIYIATIFGDDAAKTQSFAIVPNAGYDPVAVFGSRCGMSVLFGDGECGQTPVINSPLAQ